MFEDAVIQLEIAQANRQSNLHRIEQARASLKSTSDAIRKTSIASPIDGIVTSLKVEEGEVAIIGTMNNPGTVLLTIADLSVMEAEVLVDETDVVEGADRQAGRGDGGRHPRQDHERPGDRDRQLGHQRRPAPPRPRSPGTSRSSSPWKTRRRR